MPSAVRKKPPLARNIRAARLALGFTQLELAHALGFKGGDAGAYISRVEGGLSEPRLPMLGKIARALRTTLGELLAGR